MNFTKVQKKVDGLSALLMLISILCDQAVEEAVSLSTELEKGGKCNGKREKHSQKDR